MSGGCVRYPKQNNIFYGNTLRASNKLMTNQIETLQGDVCLKTRNITTGIKGISSITELQTYLADLNGEPALIYLEGGGYILNTPLVIPGNVKIMGSTAVQTSISVAGAFDVTQTPFVITGSFVVLENLTLGGASLEFTNGCLVTTTGTQQSLMFDGVRFENAGTNVAALCLGNTTNVILRDCEFLTSYIGINFLGNTDRTMVDNCSFSGVNDTGIELQPVGDFNTNVHITGCTFEGTNPVHTAVGANNITITECSFTDSSTITTEAGTDNILIANNQFLDITGNCINIGNTDDVIIDSNIMNGHTLSAILIGACNNVRVTNNDMVGVGGLSITTTVRLTISNNNIVTSDASSVLIGGLASDVIVSNNNISANPAGGIGTTGIAMSGTESYMSISDNTINGLNAITLSPNGNNISIHDNLFGASIVDTPIIFPTQVLASTGISILTNVKVPATPVISNPTGTALPFGSSSCSQLDLTNAGAPDNFVQIDPLPISSTGHTLLLNAVDVGGATITVEFNGAIFADGTTIDFTADGATALLTWMGTRWTCFGTLGLSAAGAAVIP